MNLPQQTKELPEPTNEINEADVASAFMCLPDSGTREFGVSRVLDA